MFLKQHIHMFCVHFILKKGAFYFFDCMCPLFAMRNGILGGSDCPINGIYLAHRGKDVKIDLVEPITPNDTTRITFIPDKILRGKSGIVYIPNGYQYNANSPIDYQKNYIVATLDGVNFATIWESDELTAIKRAKIFERKNDILIYDANTESVIIYEIPVID